MRSWWWWVAVVIQCLKVTALVTTSSPPGLPANKPQRCTYHRAFRMQGAHCSQLDLHAVPTTLKTNIEILDVSYNRIRELRNTTFTRYSYLRYLYLGDNMIQHIEEGAFTPLTSLETLDLSLNALSTIPASILNLPSLRKLYMSDNTLINLQRDVEAMEKPIKAPLNFLSIAKCHLSQMPAFGLMPDLEHLNVSGNNFEGLAPRDFAQMCILKNVDLTGSIHYDDTCSYKAITVWFNDSEVVITPDFYAFFHPDTEEKQCEHPSQDDIQAHAECKSKGKIKQMNKSATKMWLIIAGCLGGLLLCLIILFICLHRRNVKQTRNVKKTPPFMAESTVNNANLLGDVS